MNLDELIAEFKTLVPQGGLLAQHREPLTVLVNDEPITLAHQPEIGSLILYDVSGDEIALKNAAGAPLGNYTVNYVAGTVTLNSSDYPTGSMVVAVYKYDASMSHVIRAVRDLGLRVPQRANATIEIDTNGVALLPDTFQSLVSISRLPNTPSDDCTVVQADLSPCNIFVRGDRLIVDPPPDEAYDTDICFWQGYPLVEGYFVGLSRDLADIALLKAIAIAYRSPQMTEVVILSSGASSGKSETSGELIELTYGVEDQRTIQRWEPQSETFADRSKVIKTIASDYETQYEGRINAIRGIAKIGNKRGGYKNKHWGQVN